MLSGVGFPGVRVDATAGPCEGRGLGLFRHSLLFQQAGVKSVDKELIHLLETKDNPISLTQCFPHITVVDLTTSYQWRPPDYRPHKDQYCACFCSMLHPQPWPDRGNLFKIPVE